MNALSTHQNPSTSKFPVNGFLLLVLLLALICAVTANYTPPPDILQDNRLKTEKKSGRNEPHANQKAKESAQQKYEKVKQEFEHWDKKPKKTPEEKKYVQKLRKLMNHLRKKRDFSGEHHSQKPKGN